MAIAIASAGITYLWLISTQGAVQAQTRVETGGLSIPPQILSVVPQNAGLTIRLKNVKKTADLTLYIVDARRGTVLKRYKTQPEENVYIPWVRNTWEYVIIKACQESCGYSSPVRVPPSTITGWTVEFQPEEGNAGTITVVATNDYVFGAAPVYITQTSAATDVPITEKNPSPYAIVGKISSDGEPIWARELNLGEPAKMRAVTMVGNDVILAGEFNSIYGAVISLREENGDVMRAVAVKGIISPIATADENYVYLVGLPLEGAGIAVIAVDPKTLSVVWSNTYTSEAYALRPLSADGNRGLTIAFSGVSTTTGATTYGILHISSTGTVEWAKTYSYSGTTLVPVSIRGGLTTVASLQYVNQDTGTQWTYIAELNGTGAVVSTNILKVADSNNIIMIQRTQDGIAAESDTNDLAVGNIAWHLPAKVSDVTKVGEVLVAPVAYEPASATGSAKLYGIANGAICTQLQTIEVSQTPGGGISWDIFTISATPITTTESELTISEENGTVVRVC